MRPRASDSGRKWTDTQTVFGKHLACLECSQPSYKPRPTPPTGVTSPRHYYTASPRTTPGWQIFWPRTDIFRGRRKKIQKRSCNRQTLCQSDGMQSKSHSQICQEHSHMLRGYSLVALKNMGALSGFKGGVIGAMKARLSWNPQHRREVRMVRQFKKSWMWPADLRPR